MQATFEMILSAYDGKINELAEALRTLLLSKFEGIEEQPDVPGKIIGYAYGKGYKDTICTLIPSRKGIKLGFYKGSELPDPAQLLTGSGKVHKYVEITNERLKDPALHKLLQEGLKAYEKRMKK